MPSSAQVRESAGRKSWRTPTSTAHPGATLRPYSASSDDDSVRPRLRSPSVRSHRRLMLPPIQPVASQAWPLLLLPSQCSRRSISSRLLISGACSIAPCAIGGKAAARSASVGIGIGSRGAVGAGDPWPLAAWSLEE
ncbi:hypothetical protein G6F63_015971 [Rhizopus arrhizus]|nr:hypothetical protein G6F63_015971 [Rhizopus arrhizus]